MILDVEIQSAYVRNARIGWNILLFPICPSMQRACCVGLQLARRTAKQKDSKILDSSQHDLSRKPLCEQVCGSCAIAATDLAS